MSENKGCKCKVSGYRVDYNQPDPATGGSKAQYVICDTIANVDAYLDHLSKCVVTDIRITIMSEKELDIEQFRKMVTGTRKAK